MNGFISSVITGLLAAAAVGLTTWGIHRVRESRLSRRYPVAGSYASVFEDRVGGVRVTTKATAELHQRGLHVWGETNSLLDGRQWVLDGHLSPGGRLYGTYGAESPHDSGQGGFYLELSPDGRLDGVWAGFDSRNKDITAGRYQFWVVVSSRIGPTVLI